MVCMIYILGAASVRACSLCTCSRAHCSSPSARLCAAPQPRQLLAVKGAFMPGKLSSSYRVPMQNGSFDYLFQDFGCNPLGFNYHLFYLFSVELFLCPYELMSVLPPCSVSCTWSTSCFHLDPEPFLCPFELVLLPCSVSCMWSTSCSSYPTSGPTTSRPWLSVIPWPRSWKRWVVRGRQMHMYKQGEGSEGSSV